MDEVTHSGTGRFAWLTMRPMSLYESRESNGKVSLESLFKNENNISAQNELNLNDIAFLCCRGGWPRSTFMEREIALDQVFDYYDAVIHLQNGSYGLIEIKLEFMLYLLVV